MKIHYLLILFIMLLPTPGIAQMTFIPLNHQSPETIADKVKPFLGDGESVIAGHNEIIISADSNKIEEIKILVNKLDQAPHRLLILVSRNGQFNQDNTGYQANIIGNLGGRTGTSSSISGHATVYSNKNLSNDNSTEKINVLDGHPAFIASGNSEPVPVIQIQQHGVYQQTTTGTEYHDSSTGFYVTPRLSRESVILEISPWKESPLSKNRTSANYERLSTVVRGPLNTWIALSAISNTNKQSQSKLLGKHYQTTSNKSNIWVKVIDLDANN